MRTLRCVSVSEIAYTVRRSSRARRVRVNVHAHAGVEVVLPTRAPERAAAAAVTRAAPVDRAAPGRGARGARARGRAGRHGALPRRVARAGAAGRAHPRASPRRRSCSCPTATLARRSSASIVAPRVPRSRRGWTMRRRSPERPTATSRSARRSTRWASCCGQRRDELQLAPLARARARARLRRLARGLPPTGARPLAALLGLLERRCPDYEEDREWLRVNGATLVL